MADSTYTEKPLLKKIQDLLERKQENYDVAFCVGKEKKIVGAVKIILKASSAFLEKEFEEKWEVAVIKEGDGIPLPDFDPIAFELFVKLTSLDTWSLDCLKALNLPPNQILNLLLICRRLEMKNAEQNLKILTTIFLQSFGEYKDTDDFLQLSQTNLKYVLGSSDIGINELKVFHAAMRWADFQCKQMKVEPTEPNIQKVLGDCLFEIRFPIMTRAEFTEARESKDMFTADESRGIYAFIGLTGNKKKSLEFDSKKLPFKTTPRNKVQPLKSNQILETSNSETISALGISRLCPHVLESASSFQLPGAASPSNTICWGNKINGFPPRIEHAAVAVNNAIYCIGGWVFGDLNYLRDVLDVFVLKVNEPEKQWKKLVVKNSEVHPNQRCGHSAVAHKECVLIFGGWDAKKDDYSNSTYLFNTQTRKWDQPKVTGNIPRSRWFHSAVVLRNEMLIYGGGGIGVTNDLHALHLESFCWSTIKTKGIPPSIRWNHSATVHDDRFILIFGGFDKEEDKTVNTNYSLDCNNKTWTAVETRGTPPSSRRNHCAFVYNGQMYIFGGSNSNSNKEAKYFNDVFSYDPETCEWKELTPNGEAPSPRRSAGCVALTDQVFIFGGVNGYEGYLEDTHVLQI